MSVVEAGLNGAAGGAGVQLQAPPASPFAPATLVGAVRAAEAEFDVPGAPISTPFAEAFASYDESDLEAEAYDMLRAEFADEDFLESLESLADEAAGRHLAAAHSWGGDAQALAMAGAEVRQWLAPAAERADQLLAELEAHFGDRTASESVEAEIQAVVGARPGGAFEGPLDARELFLGKLIGKVTKVVSGVGKLVAKGVRAVGKLLPLGKLFAFLKKLIHPLLQRVLQKAIGKLPPELQPAARKLATHFGFGPRPAGSTTSGRDGGPAGSPPSAVPTPAGDPGAATPSAGAGTGDPAAADAPAASVEALVEAFDARLAEAVLAPHESFTEALLGEAEAEVQATAQLPGEGPYAELDAARERLVGRLLEADPGRPPLAELEEFIPVVMAAMKIVKLGIKIIGRKRVVEFLAKLLAKLIQPMVGQQVGLQLSRHIAGAGLKLLGLEAERQGDGRLGAEALVATAEDTLREVLSLPAQSLESELLLEAAVEEAFTHAALRHFPAQVLRADLGADDRDRGVWVLFPRAGARRYRYKKYSIVEPVLITPPLARSIFLGGETLEDRLLDAGVRGWPVQAEVHYYETLPGAELGHLAAFEVAGSAPTAAEGALEFEELAAVRPMLATPPRDHGPGPGAGPHAGPQHGPQPGPRGHGRDLPPGSRLVRVVVPGLRLRRRSPLRLRLDLTGAKPQLRVGIHLGERVAHELIRDLEQRRMVQVLSRFRQLAGHPLRELLAVRLGHRLAKHGITLAEGGRDRLAEQLAEAIVRAVAHQLPSTAAALTAAARDDAPGVTIVFTFTFDSRAAIAHAKVEHPTLTIRSGEHRD